ncbi:MAG TPA: LLM class flavin-dependent oxidoreductase [Candidatus Limnocylindrales bacterium]|nr:LLM class flavin-dependent oxidoreductase [Candidatus Limnocylindrales bacterium]
MPGAAGESTLQIAQPLRFGLFLSQANHTWAEVLASFELAEDLGFDHAWLVDHLVDTDGPPEHGCLEGWTLLAAIAARTARIRLGILVSSNTFRHPALLLKEAVTVDHVSGGRVILGLGTGWHADEHRRYGIDLPPPPERVDRFQEAVEVVTSLMGQERTTYAGRHYRLDDARLEPRPVQRPRIPLLIAAHRPRMLRIAARYADQWDTFAALPGTATDGIEAELAERIQQLDAACAAIGRDPHEIRRSTWATNDVLASPDAYLEYVRRHRALGFTDFSTVAPAPEQLDTLRTIARDVIPELRAGRLLD